MKKLIILFIPMLLNSCIFQDFHKVIVDEPNGRTYLKEMKLKQPFISSMGNFVCDDCIYYNYYCNNTVNFKLYTTIRFFKTGQYIKYFDSIGINYNNLNSLKKGWVGYYNVKDSIIILESPNLSFGRAKHRVLDKYKILSNGDLKGITKAADYGTVYERIKTDSLKEVAPNW